MDDGAIVKRVRTEFMEMPGLRLTPAQAMRLWSIDAARAADTDLAKPVAISDFVGIVGLRKPSRRVGQRSVNTYARNVPVLAGPDHHAARS